MSGPNFKSGRAWDGTIRTSSITRLEKIAVVKSSIKKALWANVHSWFGSRTHHQLVFLDSQWNREFPLRDWRAQFKVHLTPTILLYLEKSENDAYYDYATLNGKLLSKRKMLRGDFFASLSVYRTSICVARYLARCFVPEKFRYDENILRTRRQPRLHIYSRYIYITILPVWSVDTDIAVS